jgi:hypothetical protein
MGMTAIGNIESVNTLENVNDRRRTKRHARTALAAGIGLAILLADVFGVVPLISDAQARVGQPWTPLSYAGVARRTTARWAIRRSSIYVATLPAACVRTSVNGVVVWRCGGTYYQAYGGRYVVVYVR